MFKVHGRFTIAGSYSPAISFCINIACAKIDHWFNCKYHPFFQFGAISLLAIVWYLGILMQASAQSVTDQFPDHSVSVLLLCMFLDGKSDISHSVARRSLLNTFIQ